VEADIFSEINLGFNPKVVSSISTNNGVAFVKSTEFAVDTNENEGTSISSPAPNPNANNVACNEDVPEFNTAQ
jgi:hypothetical protein